MKYSDYATLDSRYVEEVAYQRLIEEARRVFGFPASLPESAVRSAAMAEVFSGALKLVSVDSYITPGVADQTAGLNAAAQAAGSTGLLYFTPGSTYTTTGTVTILGPCEGARATINYTGTGIALQVGDGTNLIQDEWLSLPKVVQAAKTTGLGWGTHNGTDISASIGVKMVRVFNSKIFVPYVRNFAVGLLEYGAGQGADYNTIFIGHLSNNEINHQLDGDGTGWTNENVRIGGRMSHDSAELQSPNTATTGQPGVRHVLISKPATQLINNQRWRDVSLEGDVPEYHVECKGSSCLFDFCRWEASVPKVKIDGATAADNVFRGGYGLHTAVFTHANGATGTRISHRDGERWAPAPGAAGVYVLSNGNSSADPVFALLDAGLDPSNFSGDTWSVQFGPQRLKGKLTGDAAASPRVDIDFTNGLGAFTFLGAAGSAAATVLGSVVKKLPIYDMAGTLLGYLPIYDAIT